MRHEISPASVYCFRALEAIKYCRSNNIYCLCPVVEKIIEKVKEVPVYVDRVETKEVPVYVEKVVVQVRTKQEHTGTIASSAVSAPHAAVQTNTLGLKSVSEGGVNMVCARRHHGLGLDKVADAVTGRAGGARQRGGCGGAHCGEVHRGACGQDH
jgi:hypothetical protein